MLKHFSNLALKRSGKRSLICKNLIKLDTHCLFDFNILICSSFVNLVYLSFSPKGSSARREDASAILLRGSLPKFVNVILIVLLLLLLILLVVVLVIILLFFIHLSNKLLYNSLILEIIKKTLFFYNSLSLFSSSNIIFLF
jgi:hypothetical protein